MAKVTSKVANEVSWEHIQWMVDQGMASNFHPGDEVSDVLKDGSNTVFAVAAVNHYQDDELIFVMKDCIGEELPMNEEDTNYGGWPKSYLREKANTDILAMLPDDLVSVIAPRKITQVIRGEKFECEDKLWLPSEVEYSGESRCGVAEEGDKQFEFYKDARNRISLDADGDPCWKWERSPNRYNSNHFAYVNTSGYPSYNYGAYYRYGVALGFCIRKSK